MIAFLVALLSVSTAQQESPNPKLEREIAAAIERVRPSVVLVSSSFSAAPGETLVFSGIVYTADGAIVTDATGVSAAGGLRVTVGERTLPARHVASDRRTGVAVIRIDAKGLRPAPLAAAPCRPGTATLAVGKASESLGAVRSVGCTIVVGGRRYEDMIRLAAPFRPGDCGGIVADLRGRLVGLIHSIAGPVEKADGFATPAAWVKFSADRILKYGRAVRGWLGVRAKPLDAAARERLGLPEDVGAEVIRLRKDGPAGRAGLAISDVLLEFDGETVRNLDALRWKIARVEQPETVKVTVLRGGKRMALDVRIEMDPQE